MPGNPSKPSTDIKGRPHGRLKRKRTWLAAIGPYLEKPLPRCIDSQPSMAQYWAAAGGLQLRYVRLLPTNYPQQQERHNALYSKVAMHHAACRIPTQLAASRPKCKQADAHRRSIYTCISATCAVVDATLHMTCSAEKIGADTIFSGTLKTLRTIGG